MKITVITPFYEGEKYMDGYVDCILANYRALEKVGHELEVILVNDSPWVKLEAPATSEGQIIKVITNDENMGIHASRVAGLAQATGDYVMFLDQDDVLIEDALVQMLRAGVKAPNQVVVANALLEQADGSKLLWYRTDYHKSKVGDLDTYLQVGIQIVSPGQCIIPRALIPEFWTTHLVTVNGADDYYLWILMLAAGVKFTVLDEACYIHKYTAQNISADTTATDASVYDFINLLPDYESITQTQIETLLQMISYKADFRSSGIIGKAASTLANFNLFLINYKYKKNTKTPLGFNR